MEKVAGATGRQEMDLSAIIHGPPRAARRLDPPEPFLFSFPDLKGRIVSIEVIGVDTNLLSEFSSLYSG